MNSVLQREQAPKDLRRTKIRIFNLCPLKSLGGFGVYGARVEFRPVAPSAETCWLSRPGSLKICLQTMNTTLPLASLTVLVACSPLWAQPDPNWMAHDRNRRLPPVVTPGRVSTPETAGTAPSDAVVLFDGKDLSQWSDMQGKPTKWIVKDGYMECVKRSGYIRTVQNFGDCQLHVEWSTPKPAEGEGQGRGNSGVFFGRDRYEIQVLDSYGNKTYADGSAGSIYGQYPPLVNASLPPGEWQTYDIIYTAPKFDAGGKLLSTARITAFHNGVLIQNNSELTGPTAWIDRAPYSPHPEKQPIAFQDHGNPVRYRNVWVRELSKPITEQTRPAKPQIVLTKEQLDRFVGKYGNIEVRRDGDNLVAPIGGVKLTFFAETQTKFFAKTTDVQFEFKTGADGEPTELVWSVGEGSSTAKRAK
jgi:hypothetical protein